jgi:hypothetical protein
MSRMRQTLRVGLLLLLVAVTSVLPDAAADIVTFVAAPLELSWLETYGTLTIGTPDGLVFSQDFQGGSGISFNPLGQANYQAPDGSYTWQGVLGQPSAVNADLRAAAATSRAGDGDPHLDAAHRAASARATMIQSGAFQVLNGAIVPSDAVEPGVPSRGAGPRGMTTDAPRQAQWIHDDPAIRQVDQMIADDLVVQGSACIGLDCVVSESLGFDTIRLKENSTSTFPNHDCQLTANDSASGGANKFSIENITAATVPVTVTGSAPTNSIFVDSTGRVGLRTATPVLDLHTATSNTPAHRFEQNDSGGFTAHTWDVAGNEANFFIRHVTGGSSLPFRIRPGAPTSSIDISASGSIGIGTPASLYKLDVVGEINLPAANTYRRGGVALAMRQARPQGILYVGPAGNDSNDGLTPLTALATITKAVNIIQTLWDNLGTNPQIRLLPGSYTEDILVAGSAPGGSDILVNIISSTGNIADVTWHGHIFVTDGAIVTIDHVTLGNPAAGLIDCTQGATVDVGEVKITAVNGNVFSAGNRCTLNVNAPTEIAGNATALFVAGGAGAQTLVATTITISANVAIGITAYALRGGIVDLSPATFALGGHTVTGQRWIATDYGIVQTPSAADSFIPGTSPGLSLAGGYAFSHPVSLYPGAVGIGTTTPNLAGFGAGVTVVTVESTGQRGVLELANSSTGTSGVAGQMTFNNGATQLAALLATADGAVTSGAFGFYTNDSGGGLVDRLHIKASGAVGINTVSPDARLTVSGLPLGAAFRAAPSEAVAHFVAADNTNSSVMVDAFNGAAAYQGRSARGTAAVPSASGLNDQLNALIGFGFGATGYSATARGGLGIYALGTWTDSSQPTGVTIFTTPSGSTTVAERVRVDAAGSVGIGTARPTELVHMSSSATTGTALRVQNTDAGGGNYRLLASGTGNTGGAGKFHIFDETAAAFRVSLDGTGNVGIGTASPAVQLHTTAGVRFAGVANCSSGIQSNANGDLSCIVSTREAKNVAGDLAPQVALANVMALRPRVGSYKSTPEALEHWLIAEETAAVDAALVGLADGKPYTVKTQNVVADLIAVVQLQQRRIEDQQRLIERQQQRLEALERAAVVK